MSLYKTRALILSKKDFGEADRVYVAFSYERGVITLKAKSARRIKSKLAGSIESFSEVELLVAESRKIDVITNAVTLKRRPEIKNDYGKVAAASVISGVIRDFIKEPNPTIYREASECLDVIEVDSKYAFAVSSAFTWRVIALVGYAPELHNCVTCGERLTESLYFFSPKLGGLLCSNEPSAGRELSVNEIKTLRIMSSLPPGSMKRLPKALLTLKLHTILLDFLAEHVGRTPKAIEFAYNLHNEEKERV